MTSIVRQPDAVITCDGLGCIALPDRAPRIYVPAKASGTENHRYDPVTLAFPHLHYCEKCWEKHVRLDDLLTDKVKRRIEERGRSIWPQGVLPDFDAALIDPLDVFSPEYRAYMLRIGLEADGIGWKVNPKMRRALAGRP